MLLLLCSPFQLYAQNKSIELSIQILPELQEDFKGKQITVFGLGQNQKDTTLSAPYFLKIDCDTMKNVIIFLASEVEFPNLGTYKYFNESRVVAVPAHDTIIQLNVQFPPECFYNKNVKQKICPLCKKKDKVIPILYGLTVPKTGVPTFKYGEYEPAGCEISDCDPTWYCKRDNLRF